MKSVLLPGLCAAFLLALPSAAQDRWVGTWACAPQLTEPQNMPPAPGLSGSILRQTVQVSIGGRRLRVHFSNLYGDGPATMNEVRFADRTLTFGGKASTTIPAGESIVSDAFDYDLAPGSGVTISIAFGKMPAAVTGHPGSRSTSYLGDTPTVHWYILTGIDVMGDQSAVVVLGDSITDGRGSTPDGNNRWPDDLAKRMGEKVAVLNMGIGGNNVVAGGLGPPAVTRFDRDVLGQPSVKWLIVLEGVNDIGTSGANSPSDNLIAAYKQFIEKAHAHGIRAYGVPILPFGGSMYASPAHEAARQTVNNWIRTSGNFDAVLDLDAAVRNPEDPAALLPAYDSGDHLHLNPAGYQRMADAIDPGIFKP